MTCYVDPNDATRAVLDRGLTRSFWLALIPLPFLLGGVAMMRIGVKQARGDGKGDAWRAEGEGGGSDTAAGLPSANEASGPVMLRPSKQRWGKAFGLLLLGLFWNGIVSIPVTMVVRSWIAGDPDICLLLFMIPFVGVGGGIVVGFVRQVLLLFAPVIDLELNRAAAHLGETVELTWRVRGRLWRLTGMTIVLVGDEKATYQQGSDTTTDYHTFFKLTLAGAADGGQSLHKRLAVPERGSVSFTIPADTMHSFEAPNNKVLWRLKVEGHVHRWPDPKDTHALTVLPRPIDATGKDT